MVKRVRSHSPGSASGVSDNENMCLLSSVQNVYEKAQDNRLVRGRNGKFMIRDNRLVRRGVSVNCWSESHGSRDQRRCLHRNIVGRVKYVTVPGLRFNIGPLV
jgi:hypothetical protein